MSGTLEFHAVDANRWPDFEALFESRGAPKYCWCMAWRAAGAERKLKGPERKEPMRRRIMNGEPVGLLAYDGGSPVAWVSIAPRETYRPLGGVEVEGEKPGDVWSLACFFVKRSWRGRGVTRRLIAAATEHARENGAKTVEAYPVDPESPSYRFMGFVPVFGDAGFREMGMAGTRRHVMRLDLP